MKEISLFVICLLLISIVSGEEDLTCKAGEYPPYGFTSGYASQCSGISKITTEAECKLAAEYNSKNIIDKNEGYGGRVSGSGAPPGCFYSGSNKYYWNIDTKSTRQCSNGIKCICKPKTCINCPINYYSEGGINPTCTPCPKDRPNTNFKTGQTSINACIPVPTIKCEPGYEFINDGITKPKKCERCKYRSYSAGGDDVKCIECPSRKRYTFINLPQTSIASCTEHQEAIKCEPGEGGSAIGGEIFKSGDASQCSGLSKITTEADCKLAAEYNSKNNIDKNEGFGGRKSSSYLPPGCYYSSGSNKYKWNDYTKSTKQCSKDYKCICKTKTCIKCPINYYSEGGINPTCKLCKDPKVTNTEQTKCIDKFQQLFDLLNEQKEKQNDLSIKNSRLWQKEQIRLHHDKYMQDRKSKDNEKEKESCEAQRIKGTVIFPAIEISNEIEKIEDTTCIDTNRDELLKSFCSFTSDLDNLFQIQSIDEEAKTFWPNICCKERRDTTLEVCEDPSGELNRGEIVPFALSSGGNYSRHNLYVEVTDTIKYDGYLHKGMLDLLKSLKHIRSNKKQLATNLVNTFFKSVSTCGPRIIDAPNAKDDTKLCELFISYHHSMKQFYNLIEDLYATPIPLQESSFIETMEESLLNRQQSNKINRLGKTSASKLGLLTPGLATAMQSKSKNIKAEKKTTCSNMAHFGPTELETKKKLFCKGSNQLDLSNVNVKNIAIYYLKDEISKHYKNHMISVKKQIRYNVVDESCPSALFDAKDISIQQVAMDTKGEIKEWVAAIHLNTEDQDGYLQSELPKCNIRNYLIGTNIKVNAYMDSTNCCEGSRDYNECKGVPKCKNTLLKMKDDNDNHFSRNVKLTGSIYTIKDANYHQKRRRRRRLFASAARSASGTCANRL